MIDYIEKDIVTVGMGIVAHGVNCQGKMGSGVAKAIRDKWPEVYEAYRTNPTGRAMLGTCHLVQIEENDSLFVANLYTQVFYGYGGGRYADSEAVRRSLDQCAMYAEIYDLPIIMPKIGCGLGGLSWESDIKPIVESISEKYPRVDFLVTVWE